jgi:Flp pilus assembly protein TadG
MDEDRGSGAGAVIIFALLFLALAGFVVDGGLSISKRERAADIAEQAARYAADDLDEDALRADGKAVIIYADCGDRVREFAQQSGLTGADLNAAECTSATADRVEVSIQLTYHPVLTGFFYSGSVTVHGTAAAEVETG